MGAYTLMRLLRCDYNTVKLVLACNLCMLRETNLIFVQLRRMCRHHFYPDKNDPYLFLPSRVADFEILTCTIIKENNVIVKKNYFLNIFGFWYLAGSNYFL